MLAQRLKDLRKRRGITQADLAEMLGITQQAVARWETAKSEPDSAVLNWLADFYGVSIDYLFGRSNKATLLDKDENTLIARFRQLPEKARQTLLAVANQMAPV